MKKVRVVQIAICILAGILITIQVARPAFWRGSAERLEGFFFDAKFRFRGTRPLTQKILVVGIDENSIATLGRWPWHRDALAVLLERIMQSGAKSVGFDAVFAEADPRLTEDFAAILKQHG